MASFVDSSHNVVNVESFVTHTAFGSVSSSSSQSSSSPSYN